MTTLDTILNFIIPPVVLVATLWMIGKAMAKPLGGFWEWIKGFIKKKDELPEIYSLEYE